MSDDLEPGWAPLDPTRDADRWESMVRGIMGRAAPILAGYAARGPADWLAAWVRPTLAAAAAVAVLALGALVAGGRGDMDGDAPAIALGDALGLPAPVTAWVSNGRAPTLEELALAMEERNR